MLQMPAEWRFGAPGPLDATTVNCFFELVLRIAAQDETWSVLELFKAAFQGGASASSNESWARSDLRIAMHAAGDNGPAFIDAFWTAREKCLHLHPGRSVPDAGHVNGILAAHGERYEIRPPRLVLRGDMRPVPVPEVGLDERARALVERSIRQSETLLGEGRHRQAVQEALWLLETVTTGFEGHPTNNGEVVGKYFGPILRDLRRLKRGTVLAEAVGWMTTLHGYLSSPTGGGVRHGTRLVDGVDPSPSEAALYCNLTRAYIGFLLDELVAEHRRHPSGPPQ